MWNSYLHGVLFLSGAAALGYEIVWVRFFAFGLGQEAASLLAVLAAHFAGLGLGAIALSRFLERAPNPARSCAGLELIAGVWGLATLGVIPQVNALANALIGTDATPARLWTIACVLPFASLLPGTFALGGTLPAMNRLVAGERRRGRSIAGLYAANTLGAAAGTVAATFFLIPSLGFRRTLVVLAVTNLACAAAILAGPARERQFAEASEATSNGNPNLAGRLFIAGFLGLGFELLAVRVVGQVLENTIYTFASSLSVFLLASAAGAAIYQRLVSTMPDESSRRERLAVAITVACLLAVPVMAMAKPLYESMARFAGDGFTGSLLAEAALATAVFSVPAGLMGAFFAHLLRLAAGTKLGAARAVGINMLGAALAPIVWSMGLLPALGARATIALLSLGYLVMLPARSRSIALGVVPLTIVPFLPDLVLVEPPAGGTLDAAREGATATAAVVRDAGGALLLKANDRFYMGSTAGVFGARRMAHIPLLFHSNPRRAAFLGVGTGMTFAAAASHPGLTAEGVELLPEIAELLPYFRDVNGGLPDARGLRLHVGDARRYVRIGQAPFDVIVADLFHPALDGAGLLYTRNHFQAIRARLAPDGLFCQWLPLHQLDASMLRVLVATFRDVFPHARAYIAHLNIETPALGLVGTLSEARYPADWYERRVASASLRTALARDGLHDTLSLLGTLIASDLRPLASGAGVQTDDRPVVMFLAPRLAYSGMPSWSLLNWLLDSTSRNAAEVIAPGADAERLEAYWHARDLYLRAEIVRARGGEAEDLLLASVRASRDFATSYARLYYDAVTLATQKPDRARAILHALVAAHPERPEAWTLLGGR